MRRRRCLRLHRRIRQRQRAGQQMQAVPRRAIERVADYRPAHMRAMHPQLMRAAGLWCQCQPGSTIAAPEHLPERYRRLPVASHRHAPAASVGDFGEGGGDFPDIFGGVTLHHRPIGLRHTSFGKRRLRGDQRLFAKSDQQTAGGVGIQSMHQPRTVAAFAEGGEKILNTLPTARPSMDLQPGRLVEHNIMRVRIEKGQVYHRGTLTAAPRRRKAA